MDVLRLGIGILLALAVVVFLLGSALSRFNSTKSGSTRYSQQDVVEGASGAGGEGDGL